jgi:AraC-like DNA-binding protein
MCSTHRRLLAFLKRVPADAILVELRDLRGRSAVPFVAGLHVTHPPIPVIGVVRVRAGDAREVVAAARAGIRDVVIADYEDAWSVVRRALKEPAIQGAVTRASEALGPYVPASSWIIVDYCLRHTRPAVTPDHVSRALGIPRRTLARQLARAGLPSPAALISWTRLAIAAALLEGTSLSVDRIAELAGFPNTIAFRQCLRRHTGMNPLDLRQPAGITALAACFHLASKDSKAKGIAA